MTPLLQNNKNKKTIYYKICNILIIICMTTNDHK